MKQVYLTPEAVTLEIAPASGCLLETSVQGSGNQADMNIISGPDDLFGSPIIH